MRTAIVLFATLALAACASTGEKPTQTSADGDGSAQATDGEDSAPAEPPPPPPEGKVAFDTSALGVEPASGMSRGAAARVALESAGKLNDCYREGLRDDPKLTLALDLQVAVDVEGRGKLIGIDGAELSPAMKKCFEEVISVMPFEWPSADVEITYPVTFAPAA